MKANEVPERLYVHRNILGDVSAYEEDWCRPPHCVEYIRKDAFIEKAVKWIEEINNHYYIMRYSDSCEPPLNELTEWFKNYMKEGGKDE